jgi:hypothetical protein
MQKFLIDLAGKMEPPIFAATLVTCLLMGEFGSSHALLMGLAGVLICINYGYTRR